MPFLEEIAATLVGAGVGDLNVDIFLGRKSSIPQGAGPYLSLIETGGTGPTRIQNQAGAATQRPTAQILVRANRYPDARAMCKAAYDVLDGIFNTTLGGTFYLKVTARQEPTDLGLEEGTARAMVAFNIDAEKYVS